MPDSTLFNIEVSVTPGSIPGPPLPQLLRRRPSPPINTSQPTERPLTSTSNSAPQKAVGRATPATASRTTKTDPSSSVLSGDAVVTMPDGEPSGVGGGEVRPWVGKVNITMGEAGCTAAKGLWWLVLVAILGCILIATIYAWKSK